MALVKTGRFLRVFSLCACLWSVSGYEIPEVKIQALKPKGFRASIPAAPDITLFAFQGNVNKQIESTAVGRLSGEVTEPSNGKWVVENNDVQLKVGDVINYYVFVSVNSAGYFKDNLSFTVTELVDPSAEPTATSKPPVSPPTTTSSPNDGVCRPSATTVRGGTACSGQTIFEDNFDKIREDVWQIEQYVPNEHPEHPFVSYQRAAVSISNGNLRITPTLQQNMPGYNNDSIISGNLNLFSGCTGSSNECSVTAFGASILPPVVSGRITSKGLAFTYGTVHIRAKLPKGDWLYPEILLEPFRKKYGIKFASGVVNIARARGNNELYLGIKSAGNDDLYGGLVMDFDCRQFLISEKKLPTSHWGDDFHVYTVSWTPDRVTLLVDDQEWARIEPTGDGLKNRFPPTCKDIPRDLLAMGSKMAPFDDHFYITLGVAAGGITEFPDDLYGQNFKQKPWRNAARKALLHFWEDQDSWYPTWRNAELLVDYVKVVAL
ncbi:carbohydrate binding domain (family 32) domain-containing protein [Phthorimaea operculella]|nr:carbohydrate binding domain (family 32) domain-containing protein [Phthorimaea operculella]